MPEKKRAAPAGNGKAAQRTKRKAIVASEHRAGNGFEASLRELFPEAQALLDYLLAIAERDWGDLDELSVDFPSMCAIDRSGGTWLPYLPEHVALALILRELRTERAALEHRQRVRARRAAFALVGARPSGRQRPQGEVRP